MIVRLDEFDQAIAVRTAAARSSSAGKRHSAHYNGAGEGNRARGVTDLVGCLGEIAVVRAFRLALDEFRKPEWAPSDITPGLEVRTARLASHRKLFVYEKDQGRASLYIFARLQNRSRTRYAVELAGWIDRDAAVAASSPWEGSTSAVDVCDLYPMHSCPLWEIHNGNASDHLCTRPGPCREDDGEASTIRGDDVPRP